MCGIALLHGPRSEPRARAARVAQAVSRLGHRGPDAASTTDGPGVSFGHTRLAIVDLIGGRQPMQDPSKRWTLVFNGEIYNYRTLRDDLVDEWQFRDASDTEVLLAGLIVRGEGFVAKLDGMFAFALHDSERGSLLLARDGFGKKPLYYHCGNDVFACASELHALHALVPELPWQEDLAGIGDYFRYGFALPGSTCIDAVHEVPPGHLLRRDADGRITIARHWNPRIEPWQGGFEEAAEHVRALLHTAVRKRQLASDVEVGAFLSGGIDSTVVCALAQKTELGRRLRTFTTGFSQTSYDERAYAERAAVELGTLHKAGELTSDRAMKIAEDLIQWVGQPFGDASLIPTAMLSELASQDVKVVLSGDGADEVFGGYSRYMGRRLLRLYNRTPAIARRAFETFVSLIPEPLSHHSGSFLKRVHLFAALSRAPRDAYVAPLAMRPDSLALLAPDLPAGNAPVEQFQGAEAMDDLQQMMLQDWLIWMPQDILAKVDRASMRHSLEVRSPFLDRDLAEFVLRLPWHWHFSMLRGKRLLRTAMRGHVPDFVWHRRKHGFASPVGHWMRGQLGARLLELSRRADTGVVAATGVRRLLDQHCSGAHDHSQALWIAFVYLAWRARCA